MEIECGQLRWQWGSVVLCSGGAFEESGKEKYIDILKVCYPRSTKTIDSAHLR